MKNDCLSHVTLCKRYLGEDKQKSMNDFFLKDFSSKGEIKIKLTWK